VERLNNDARIETNFTEKCTCVAIARKTTVMLYESGKYSNTYGLEPFLHKKLAGLPSYPCKPKYVALGSNDRYYVEYASTPSEWKGPTSMSKILHESNQNIRTVAFGEDYHTFFIVFEGGSWMSNGNIPDGLSKRLKQRNCSGDLSLVSLGPNGEWFLKALNGDSWWGGVPDSFLDEIGEIEDSITSMYFGDDWSYFVRYN